MNKAKRQALRDKHAEQYGLCVFCSVPDPDLLGHVLKAAYPCDTIKVLNALEEVLEQVNYGVDTEKLMKAYEDAAVAFPECEEHMWLSRAGSEYRKTRAEICAVCGEERSHIPKDWQGDETVVMCVACNVAWPCPISLTIKPACDHEAMKYIYEWLKNCDYCPKCGDKL